MGTDRLWLGSHGLGPFSAPPGPFPASCLGLVALTDKDLWAHGHNVPTSCSRGGGGREGGVAVKGDLDPPNPEMLLRREVISGIWGKRSSLGTNDLGSEEVCPCW